MKDKRISAAEYFEEVFGHTYNSSYSSIEMIKFAEGFAQQNTLSREKVMEILEMEIPVDEIYDSRNKRIADAICSLALPELSDEDIEHEAQLTGEIESFKHKYGTDEFMAFKNGYICAIREHVFGKERIYPTE